MIGGSGSFAKISVLEPERRWTVTLPRVMSDWSATTGKFTLLMSSSMTNLRALILHSHRNKKPFKFQVVSYFGNQTMLNFQAADVCLPQPAKSAGLPIAALHSL
jgi:hypothetical protein